ncbi:MAG: Na+/H+ antiporter subunit E [Alphaproteobacteria bacterium]
MAHAASLFVVLYATWLLLSGFLGTFFLAAGLVSCTIVVLIAHRMDVIDREGHPIHLSWRFLTYFPWLAFKIVKANIDVARRVLSPSRPIDPRLEWVPTSQLSDLGVVIYANSITLTPGTVSTTVESGRIQVHALSKEAMAEVKRGEMDRRVRSVEGS